MAINADTAGRHRRKTSVALEYDRETMEAPRVLARGKGILAERILEIARRHGVPVCEDPPLAEALAQVDVNSEVPPELFALVAEVLAFVYKLGSRAPEDLVIRRP